MMYLLYIILIKSYKNKQGNELTPEFGFMSNRRWEEQKKMKLSELTQAHTHDCRLMGEWIPLLATVGFFTEVEAM